MNRTPRMMAGSRLLAGVLAAAITMASARVRAAEEASDTPSAPAAVAAAVPGVVVHGAGHFVLGKKKTALMLLLYEGIGVGLAGGGLYALRATGASRRLVTPLSFVTVAGASLFFLSLAADLYGTLAPRGPRATALNPLPSFETRFGVRAIHDPFFDQTLLVEQGLDYRTDKLRVSPTATFAPGDANRRLRIEAAYRVTDVRNGEPTRDGTYLEIETAGTSHAYLREGFARTTGEVSVRARIDLARLWVGDAGEAFGQGSLRGSFAEGSLGLALASIHYRAGTSETDELLLARFAYGFYLGSRARPRGEVLAFYDHRRDGYAGGLKVPGIGAGYLGSVGALGRWLFDDRWGLQLDVQAGSAVLGGASVLFREGAVR